MMFERQLDLLRGLKTIVGEPDFEEFDQLTRNATELHHHPFALLPLTGKAPRKCKILAYVGYTEPSVQAMRTVLRHIIAQGTSRDKPALRIIKVATAGHAGHDLFFEVEIHSTVYMVGGCTDYTGEGGAGGKDLTATFELLAHCYRTEVVVERVSGERARIDLMNLITDTDR